MRTRPLIGIFPTFCKAVSFSFISSWSLENVFLLVCVWYSKLVVVIYWQGTKVYQTLPINCSKQRKVVLQSRLLAVPFTWRLESYLLLFFFFFSRKVKCRIHLPPYLSLSLPLPPSPLSNIFPPARRGKAKNILVVFSVFLFCPLCGWYSNTVTPYYTQCRLWVK